MNIRKIIVPEIPLPIKDRETFVLDNLRINSTITSMLLTSIAKMGEQLILTEARL